MDQKNKIHIHPLLRGGNLTLKRSYKHGFSSSQMLSLASVCEALVPPTAPHNNRANNGTSNGSVQVKDYALNYYYASTASQSPFPDETADLLVKRGLPKAVMVVKLVLRLLSTRIGTLALCGRSCLDLKWPFIHKFSELSVEKREAILQKWSEGPFNLIPLRSVFFMLKVTCFYTFFSLTDDNSRNPSWDAIGYKVEEVETQPQTQSRPLDEGIVEAQNQSESQLKEFLTQKGFEVSENPKKTTINISCDVVIVGSGCGGGVAASILSKAGLKVLVIEKGRYLTAREYSGLEGPSMNELYENGGIFATVDGKLILLAGSAVGGGSAVNWSACIKTPQHVLKEWCEEKKIAFFGGEEYASAMDEVWKRIEVTEGCKREGFQNLVLRKGCEKLDLLVEDVARNSPGNHYCGSCGYGCRRGEKNGTDKTWLVDAVNNGAVILTGVKAEKFEVVKEKKSKNPRKKTCSGVIARVLKSDKIEKKLRIEARASISACGALSTPPLLISSGIKNKNVGRNLHLHPVLFAWGYFPESSEFEGKNYEGGIITSINKVVGENPNFRTIIETAGFGPASFAVFLPWVAGQDMKERMSKYSRTAMLFTLVRDVGSGEVRRQGKVKYKLSELDKKNLKTGLRQTLRILISAGAAEVGTFRSDGQRLSMGSEGDVEKFLEEVEANGGISDGEKYWTTYCSAHQMSSCKMGFDEEEGAVDENGECFEAKGLYVCDGSVLPTAIGVNPMITIESTAYCIAKRIQESLLCKKEAVAV